MGFETWTRGNALEALKDSIRSYLDNEYDDENDLFFGVEYGDESLLIKVTDATDESLVEEFILNFQ